MNEIWIIILVALAATIGMAVGRIGLSERLRRCYHIPYDISIEGWLDLQELRLRSAEACLGMYVGEIKSLQKQTEEK